MPHQSMSHLSLQLKDTKTEMGRNNTNKRPAQLAFENATHWIDFDSVVSKITAPSTADFSSCDYSTSSSSFSSSVLFQPPKTSPVIASDIQVPTIKIELKTEDQSKSPKEIINNPVLPTAAFIPKELRDHCGKGSYWMEPTTKRRRRSSPKWKDYDHTGGLYSSSKEKGNRKRECTQKLEQTAAITKIISDSLTILSSANNKKHNKNYKHDIHIHHNNIIKTESKIKAIGIPGIRSRWAWIDNTVEPTKKGTESSHSRHHSRQTTSNRIKITTPKPKTTIPKSTKVSKVSATTVCNRGDSSVLIHTAAKTKVSASLKAIQDHCGPGSYWSEPTQRRRNVSLKWGVDNSKEKRQKKGNVHEINHFTENKNKWNSSITTTTSSSKIENRPDASNSFARPMISGNSNSTGRETSSIIAMKSKAIPSVSVTARGVHHKVTFRAVQGSNKPISQYALDLITLVCNNSYNNISGSGDGNFPPEDCQNKLPTGLPYQQVHRILDKPLPTIETESDRERFMRLQLRQRFASAASAGMSPIEFSKKLLGLWGGRLEQVLSIEESNSRC